MSVKHNNLIVDLAEKIDQHQRDFSSLLEDPADLLNKLEKINDECQKDLKIYRTEKNKLDRKDQDDLLEVRATKPIKHLIDITDNLIRVMKNS